MNLVCSENGVRRSLWPEYNKPGGNGKEIQLTGEAPCKPL